MYYNALGFAATKSFANTFISSRGAFKFGVLLVMERSKFLGCEPHTESHLGVWGPYQEYCTENIKIYLHIHLENNLGDSAAFSLTVGKADMVF